jgi:hypothetical protein
MEKAEVLLIFGTTRKLCFPSLETLPHMHRSHSVDPEVSPVDRRPGSIDVRALLTGSNNRPNVKLNSLDNHTL